MRWLKKFIAKIFISDEVLLKHLPHPAIGNLRDEKKLDEFIELIRWTMFKQMVKGN